MSSILISSVIALSIFTSPFVAQTDPASAIRIFDSASEDLSDIKEQREERVNSINEVRRETRIQTREELREEIAELRNEMLQEKLLAMADRFENLQDKWTTHWSNVLVRLTAILEKIEIRTDELETDGANVDGVKTLIEQAYVAIDDAQVFLDDLSEKEYFFDVDSEATVGENVRNTIMVMKKDMAETREAVRSAKEAVQTAFAQLRRVNRDFNSSNDIDEIENE